MSVIDISQTWAANVFEYVARLGLRRLPCRALFAEELSLVRTPRQTEGPFYPDQLPLDTDNDLLIINDSITPAVGEVTHLTGKSVGCERRGSAQRVGWRFWQWRRQRRLSSFARQRAEEGQARLAFPGLRSLPDVIDGRVLFPHDQAGSLSWPDAAHPLQDQERQ